MLALFVITPPTWSILYLNRLFSWNTTLQQTNHFIKVHYTSSMLNFLDSITHAHAIIRCIKLFSKDLSPERIILNANSRMQLC
jgi:hypothetical protein